MNQSPDQVFTSEHFASLKDHGYVVIPNVVEQPVLDKCVADLLKVFAIWDPELTPGNPSAWNSDAAPAGTIHGINRLCAQMQAQWDIRQHPRVVQAFADYWNQAYPSKKSKYLPSNMVTSMDGFNFYLAESVKRASNCWGHTDQGNATAQPLSGLCVQGFVNLIDCTGDNDGGLVVWDRGHRAWQGYWRRHPEVQTEDNWHKYPETFLKEIETNGRRYLSPSDPSYDETSSQAFPMPRVRVRAPAGALVLWYSKTPHQNDVPFNRNPKAAPGKDRAAIYVCQCPKTFLESADIKRRTKAFHENRQTSHWPAGGQVKIFPLGVGRTFGADAKQKYRLKKDRLDKFRKHPFISSMPQLTRLGKSVLGIEM